MLTLRRSLITLALAAIAPVARTGDAPVSAIRVELTVPAAHANPEDIAAVVEHLEGQADVAQAKAMVHKVSDTEGAEVVMELWGQDLPSEEELVEALQTEFPYLVGTDITVSDLDPEAQPLPQDDKDEDPEALRERIIADLRAKGVEGEIDVQITDHPDGRREVEVRVADDHPPTG